MHSFSKFYILNKKEAFFIGMKKLMNKHFTLKKKSLIFPANSQEFQICHASNICKMKNGELIAAWFAGEREGSDDVAIWYALTEGGIWGTPQMLAHDMDEPHWNPVLFQKEDGEVLILYKVGRIIAEWKTRIRISRDFGKTWSKGRDLVKGDVGGRGPVRCKMLTLSDGSILAGNSTEKGVWTAYTDRTVDGGKHWQQSNPIRIDLDRNPVVVKSDIPLSAQSFTGRGVIQPTLWEGKNGTVHMLMRSSEGQIYRADSENYGQIWGCAYPTGLPNNNSGIDVVKTDDGLLVLCMNPVSKNFGPRTPLILMVSEDNGSSWEEECILEDAGNPFSKETAEYSYPCIIADRNELLVTYTYNRKSIAINYMVRKER